MLICATAGLAARETAHAHRNSARSNGHIVVRFI
jgi:hypothetical protein